MSTAREDVGSVYPETLALPAGVTCALTSITGQMGVILKYVSGGSLTILRSPEYSSGATTVGSSFATNNIYVVGTTEIMQFPVNQTLYLMGSGSTCVASVLRLRSNGT